jgi:hypothetical protein
MTCTLTQGVPLTCRDAIGGISEIKIKALSTVPAGLQATSGQITLTELDGWYTYQFAKETGNLTEKHNINPQNRTLYYTQTLTIKLNKLSSTLQQELYNVGQGCLLIACRDNNGTDWLIGSENYAEMIDGTGNTGTAYGDPNGYELIFTANSKQPMPALQNYDSLVETAP